MPEPGAASEVGLKLEVTPEGTPLAEKLTTALNPPETAVVTVVYPLLPWATDPEVGETEMVKVPVPVW